MRIAVTIGRNIGAEPMSDRHWQNFQWSVQDRLFRSPEPAVTFHAGEWEGVAEESATIVGEARNFDAASWATLARIFKQDAIAVLVPRLSSWQLVRADGTIGQGWSEQGTGLHAVINGEEAGPWSP